MTFNVSAILSNKVLNNITPQKAGMTYESGDIVTGVVLAKHKSGTTIELFGEKIEMDESIPIAEAMGESVHFEVVESNHERLELKYLPQEERATTKAASFISVSLDSLIEKQGRREVEVVRVEDSFEYSQELKNLSKTTQLQLEIILDKLTEGDVERLLNQGFDPQKLSIEWVHDAISNNRVAHLQGNTATMKAFVDKKVEDFKTSFQDASSLTVVIESIDNNGLPIIKKHIQQGMTLLDKVDKMKALSEKELLTLIQRATPLEIDAIYRAIHSLSKSSKSLQDDENYLRLEKEIPRALIENHLERIGVDNTNEHQQLAIKMMAREIPITKENIERFYEIPKLIEELQTDKAKKQILDQTFESIRQQGKLSPIALNQISGDTKNENVSIEAIDHIINKLPEMTMRDVRATIRDVKKASRQSIDINLRDIVTPKKIDEIATLSDDIESEAINVHKNLEEIRLKMTYEVALRMASKGILVDIEPLEKVVEALRVESHLIKTETFNEMSYEPNLQEEFKFDKMVEDLQILRQDYKSSLTQVLKEEMRLHIHPMAEYEKSMTQVRADLGDRVEKTFGQFESILLDLGVTINKENLNGLEVLARAQMPINMENLEHVTFLQAQVNEILEHLNPHMVVQMLKEGIDPLSLDVSETLSFMKNFNQRFGFTHEERVAQAIVKMEADKSLAPEMKEGILGVYRMLHTISRSMGRATGFLVKNDLPVTLENLFEAAQYVKKTKEQRPLIQVDVDQDFGLLETIKQEKNLIRQDILSALKEAELPENEKMMQRFIKIEKEVEQFMLNEVKVDSEPSYEKMKTLVKALIDFSKEEPLLFRKLHQVFENPSLKEAETFKDLVQEPFSLSKALKVIAQKGEVEERLVKEVIANNKNELHLEAINDFLLTKEPSAENIKMAESITKSHQLNQALSQQEHFYQIPMVFGDKWMQLNLFWREEKENQPELVNQTTSIYMDFQTEHMGRVQAYIQMKEEATSMQLQSTYKEDLPLLKAFDKEFKVAFEDLGLNYLGTKFENFPMKGPLLHEKASKETAQKANGPRKSIQNFEISV